MRNFLFLISIIFFTPAQAANLFSWGVETNYTQASIYPVEYHGGTTRDCTVAHSGSCSMKIVVIGNDSGNQQTGADLIDLQPQSFNVVGSASVYYRTWMRIMSGFSWGSPQVANVKTSRAVGGTYPRMYTGHMRSDGFYVAECETVGGFPGGGCLTTSGVPNNDYNIRIPYNVAGKADGQWHEYIIRIKPNTATNVSDAEFQVWVDGVSVGTLTGWRLSDRPNPNQFIEAWGGWMVYPYFQMNGNSSDGGTIYFDDFSTDTTYNSIYSGGGDTTPPTGVALTAPSAGATISGTVTVSGTCTDETSIRGVQFKHGTTNIGSEDTSSPYSVSWDTTAVANGTYSLTAVCTDNGSNSTTSSARSVTVSNAAPTQECPANWKSLHPTWIYCDDFESDKSSLWMDSNYYGSRMVRSAGNGYSGTYSMRSTLPSAPTSASNGGDFTVAFGAAPVTPTVDAADTAKYRELYWRAYLRTQAGWQPGVGQKVTRATSFHNSSWAQSMIAHWWGSSASPENTLQVDPASGVCQGGVYPAGSPACTNNTVITTGWNDFNGLFWLGGSAGTAAVLGTAKANTWQCVEGYVKLNDAGQSNGVQTFWVDGVQDATKTGLNFVGSYSTYGINAFRLENYANSGTTNAQYRDWDNLVLSTGRIGCTISLPPDITPPSSVIATADPSAISADSLTVTGTASDAVGVSGCKWRVGAAPDAGNGTACTGTTSFSCATSGYSQGANTLYVGCYDAAGNYGADSIAVNLDSIAPTTPTDLDARSSSTSTVDLSWVASTDAVGVTSYRVEYCSGYACSSWATLGTSATNSYTHTGITPAANPTIYRYRVYALDAASNQSGAATSIYFNATPTIPAFPGAEGGGATSKGGRGGTVYRVTSLLGDTSAGTLRACVAASGPRTCVFAVAGNIELTGNINISQPYITIDGSTAPGGGITISGKNSTQVSLTIRTHNVTLRHFRIRKGYNAGTPAQDGDSVNVLSAAATPGPVGPVIFDHVSTSWGQDENGGGWGLAVRPPKNITYQYVMMYEPLLAHPVNFMTGAYNNATAERMTDIDLHHSLLANSSHRNPLIKNKTSRVVNNLIYNWGDWAAAGEGTVQIDFIGNRFKTGPLYHTISAKSYEIELNPAGDTDTPNAGSPALYVVGNIGQNNSDPTADNWGMTRLIDIPIHAGVELGPLSTSYRRVTPLPALPFPITAQDVWTAETLVLAGAGASRRLDCSGNWVNMRDAPDTRVVAEYTAGNAGIIPANEDAVGGYPTLAAGTACTDTDSDGMPDTWETANGLNINSAADGATLHASGYSNLERYLAGIADTTGPVASGAEPTNKIATGATSATLRVTTSEAADCRYSATSGFAWGAGTPYSTTGGTAHSSTVTVASGRNYRYYSRCLDPTGNSSNTVISAFFVPRKPMRKVW